MEKQLPQELRNINVSSKEDCIRIAQENVGEDLTKFKKYELYLARKFLMENFATLNQNDCELIFKNKLLAKVISDGNQARTIFQNALKNRTPFPVTLDSWFQDKTITKQNIVSYLEILNEHPDKQQFKDFMNKKPELVKLFYMAAPGTGLKVCEELHDVVLKREPQMIVYNKDWSEDSIKTFITFHKKLAVLLLREAFENDSYIEKNMSLRTHLYETSLNFIKSNKSQHSFAQVVQNAPIHFWQYVQEKEPSYLKEVLAKELNAETGLNLAQTLIFSSRQLGPNQLQSIFEGNENILLQSVKKEINFYKKKVHPFEYALESRNYNIFYPFLNKTHLLNEEEKKMFKAGVLAAMSDLKEENQQEQQAQESFVLQALDSISLKELKQIYLEHFKKFNNKGKSILNMNVLKKELEQNLPEKEEVIKKPKI